MSDHSAFARRIERLALLGASESRDTDLSGWIRVWAAARHEQGKGADSADWDRVYNQRQSKRVVPAEGTPTVASGLDVDL